jgi:hypothetical protein
MIATLSLTINSWAMRLAASGWLASSLTMAV